jgi:hypothetical protein
VKSVKAALGTISSASKGTPPSAMSSAGSIGAAGTEGELELHATLATTASITPARTRQSASLVAVVVATLFATLVTGR